MKRRLKPACASAQFDQRLRCPHGETLHPWLSEMRPKKILILPRYDAQADLNLRLAHMSEGWFSECTTHILTESAHDKSNTKICATSENSNQPAHLRGLIRVFADSMCLLLPRAYQKRDERELLSYLADVQADLSLLAKQILL